MPASVVQEESWASAWVHRKILAKNVQTASQETVEACRSIRNTGRRQMRHLHCLWGVPKYPSHSTLQEQACIQAQTLKGSCQWSPGAAPQCVAHSFPTLLIRQLNCADLAPCISMCCPARNLPHAPGGYSVATWPACLLSQYHHEWGQ